MQPGIQKRRPHKRSRRGCLRCKARHVRCDEALPVCGNCFKYGHECSLAKKPLVIEIMTSDSYSHTPDADLEGLWVPDTNLQPEFKLAIPYYDPLQSGLPPMAVAALNQYLQVCAEAPLPSYCNEMVRAHEDPKLFSLASQHRFVKDSLMASASSIYFEFTNISISNQMYVEYLHTALSGLQQAIETFSSENSDAILSASFCLSWGAKDWQEWSVYAGGYSKVLRRIRSLQQETLYSGLLYNNFQVIKFNKYSQTTSQPFTKIVPNILVDLVLSSFSNAKPKLTPEEWNSSGFKQFEILSYTVESALLEPSDDGVFEKLRLLRAWMFFFDLSLEDRDLNDGLRNVLRLHLYGLVLAMSPYFPEACRESLERFCREEIGRMRKLWLVGAGKDVGEMTEVFWNTNLFC